MVRFLLALALVGVVAADSKRSIARGDPYPDPEDLQDAVAAEIRRYHQAKVLRASGFESSRFREMAATGPAGGPGKVDRDSRSGAMTGMGDPGPTNINYPNKIVGQLGDPKGPPTTVTVSLTIEGSTGPNRGDTDLKKSLQVLLASQAGVVATAVRDITLTHVPGSTPPPAEQKKSLRRLLAAGPAVIRVGATIDVADELAARAAYEGIKQAVQNGDLTRTLQGLGYRELRVTGLEGGPRNGARGSVTMPAPAQCNALSCAQCAGTPNCGWCTTSNKCMSGDRDPDAACVAADGKKTLFHHWVYNPTECTDWATPATAFSYPTLVDPDHCYNGFKDADESGADCGGGCKRACVRRTSGGAAWVSTHVNTRAWQTGQPRFREMKTPEVRIAGQNPVGQRNIIPGTVEVSSTEMGSGYIPAEYHSTSRMDGDANAGATVMITPTA